jgi:iron complex transport system substrate-binding protein
MRVFCKSFLAAVICLGLGARFVAAEAQPARVISMNLCTDQLAMLLAAPGQLYSVSYLAAEPQASVLADEAAAFRINHGLAEEIFLMKPDLVLAGTYTTRATVSLLKRLGFRVEQFSPENSLDDIRASLRRMGQLLGRSSQAEALITEFDNRLTAVQAAQAGPRPVAAPYYANSYTSGKGTLAADIIQHSGLDNLAAKLELKGSVKLPLETLVMSHPDVLVTGGRWSSKPALAYELLQHPALVRLRSESASVAVPDKFWICGGPFTAEAVRILSAARQSASHAQP